MNPDEDFYTLSKNVVVRVLADSDLNSTAKMDPHPVIIKVYLKYMTMKNFDEMSKDIIEFLNVNAKHESDGTTLKIFTVLIFDKACNDHSFTKMAARISRRIAEAISRDIKDEKVREKTGEFACGGNLFQKYLLKHLQEEFEKGISCDLPDPKGSTKNNSESSNTVDGSHYWFGLVRLMAELFKVDMLSFEIANTIISKLLDNHTSNKCVESSIVFLQIAGDHLENSSRWRQLGYGSHVEIAIKRYFHTFQSLIDKPDFDPRLRSKLQELVLLRNSSWVKKPE
ncbi:armadillo-type protein [Pyronema domesticum]|uniref:Similar to Eukaryotic translation initiation factor 4 gamma acc. no. Q10475 n=1 Tax=Pyronema omphalodes (strain CBS 100304) TaxID=1076935 RepID=U4LM50_PYROM|nr:armadillo-type protein [Pyronema domesticum]CCX33214.1 Similar to Eukaryotic translation initiation factor 4 gamma; acc. no. Q10475 [Pyronema omphalodes CBS 100304]